MQIGRCSVLGCEDQAGGAVSVLPEDHPYLNMHGNPVVLKAPMCARHHRAVTVDGAQWRYDEDDGTVIVIDD